MKEQLEHYELVLIIPGSISEDQHARIVAEVKDLLKSKEGKLACINGATQIRAGVIRPEVIIPFDGDIRAKQKDADFREMGLGIGSPVRVIRHPHFGKLGSVTDLPAPLMKLESESHARVLEVEFKDGSRAVVPRANVEMIES